MKIFRSATLAMIGAFVAVTAAAGEEYPFPAIENVPERELFGADGNGYPRIAVKDMAQVAGMAASNKTPENLRFYSIWGLAISGYSPESATGLAKALADQELSDTARGYAAMGLQNFTHKLPKESKDDLRSMLRVVVKAESAETPDGIVRTLIAWDDASWVAEQLGDSMAGHPMEIEILSRLSPDQATPRLLTIYRNSEKQNVMESYKRRAEIGRALLAFEDKRGIDILNTLLDPETVPEDREKPNHQYRHNVFAAILRGVGQDFGYKSQNYDPTIDKAIHGFRDWWIEHRYEFEFSAVNSKTKSKNANRVEPPRPHDPACGSAPGGSNQTR